MIKVKYLPYGRQTITQEDIDSVIMDNSQINLLNSFIGGIQALSQELKIIKNGKHN